MDFNDTIYSSIFMDEDRKRQVTGSTVDPMGLIDTLIRRCCLV
jgi:hypothetical protein